ncbi:hypothetical protein DB30_02297 [Enhygromyxa salina]|uniref:Lipoprotein n=2 Tax=Enhygromyxa salina TaxID=215803 RepID=A0A0C1Z2Z1_9BACT|nr:hypothetical protein DB30_02297 [Enhygromyxa salina]
MIRRPSTVGLTSAMVFASLSLGCRQPPGEALTPPKTPAQTAVHEPSPACQVGLRFASYEWLPDDARLATSIQYDDPELPAALTTLARMTEAPEVALPVFAALDYRNLPMQLGNLDRMFDALGDSPAELVELHSPAGEMVWMWPSACPPALLAARVLDRWQVMLRADLEHPGLRLGAGAADGFPFDVITIGALDEQRVGLTRVGHGPTIVTWLRESARGGEDGPGRALAKLDPAPIRSVLATSMLTTASTPPTDEQPRHIRVTSSDWVTDWVTDGVTSAPPPSPN